MEVGNTSNLDNAPSEGILPVLAQHISEVGEQKIKTRGIIKMPCHCPQISPALDCPRLKRSWCYSSLLWTSSLCLASLTLYITMLCRCPSSQITWRATRKNECCPRRTGVTLRSPFSRCHVCGCIKCMELCVRRFSPLEGHPCGC